MHEVDMSDSNDNIENALQKAELSKIQAEVKRSEEEAEKLHAERLRIEKEINLPFYRKPLFIQAIIAGLVAVPMVWFYFTQITVPLSQTKEIKLSLENEKKAEELAKKEKEIEITKQQYEEKIVQKESDFKNKELKYREEINSLISDQKNLKDHLNMLLAKTYIPDNQRKELSALQENLALPLERIYSDSFIKGKYFALLVGIDDYDDDTMDLKQSVSDCIKLAAILKKQYLFDENSVQIINNPSRKKLIEALSSYTNSLSPEDNLLIYYAGHAYWDDKIEQGFWIPRDSSFSERSKWISNSTVVDYLKGMKAKHILLVADTCFSGSVITRGISMQTAENYKNEFVERLYKLPSRTAMSSGTATELVPDISGFNRYLVQILSENRQKFLVAEEIYTKLRRLVVANSPMRHMPQYGGGGPQKLDNVLSYKSDLI
jgi:hypothetical protein